MKIILLTILILLIVCYLLKNKLRENFEVKGNNQPEVSEEIYNYNIEQAVKIWNDVVGPDAGGSYKPTTRNRRIWAHENWRDELKAYVKEANKYNKEHNWFDYVPGRGPTLYIKRRDVTREKVSPIGIRKAWRRIYGRDLGSYRFPKTGDRVRILSNDNGNKDNSDYYTGIVIHNWGWGSNKKCKIIWDKKNRGRGIKDKVRWKTRGLPSEVRNRKVVSTGEEFGWPYWNWKRHWSENKAWDNVSPNTWLNTKDLAGGKHHYDSKYLYKVVECKPAGTTGCDFLRCDKRKEAVLNDFPITYFCNDDPRNRHPGIWKCEGGSKDGTYYNYYDKNTMCRENYKRGKKDTYCVQSCVGNGRCIPTTLQDEIDIHKSNSNSKCAYLVSDHPWEIEKGNYTFLKSDKGYFPTSGKIDISTDRYHDEVWKHYSNESEYKRVPHSNLGLTGVETWYEQKSVGNWFGSVFGSGDFRTRVRRTRVKPETLIRYGKNGRWQHRRPWSGEHYRCSHVGHRRVASHDPIGGTYKECQYKNRDTIVVGAPQQNYQRGIDDNILSDGKIKSMRVIGDGCKFALKSKSYNEGLHQNLDLKHGKTTCSMGTRATLYQGCGYNYQDREACLRECGGSCRPKLINLQRHGCKYSRGDKIGNHPLIPM